MISLLSRLCLVLFSLAITFANAQTYRIHYLDFDPTFEVSATNNDGIVAGSFFGDDNKTKAYIYDYRNNEFTQISSEEFADEGIEVTEINDLGVALVLIDGESYFWEANKGFNKISPETPLEMSVDGLNSKNQTVFTLEKDDGEDVHFLYNLPYGITPFSIKTLVDADIISPMSINDQGHISFLLLNWGLEAGIKFGFCVYQEGKILQYQKPGRGEFSLFDHSFLTGINNFGDIVGVYIADNDLEDDDDEADDENDSDFFFTGDRRGFYWPHNSEISFVEDLCGNPDVVFENLNDADQFVGYQKLSPTRSTAIYWDETSGLQDLNDVVVGLRGGVRLYDAQRITNNGHILVTGKTADDEEFEALLVPIESDE